MCLTTTGIEDDEDELLLDGAEEDDEDELLLDGLEVLVDVFALLLVELAVEGSLLTLVEVTAGSELADGTVDAVLGVLSLQAPTTIPIITASDRKAIFFLLFIRFSFLALCNM